MRHRLALNGATTGGDLLSDIRAAGTAGFEALEIPDNKMDAYLQAGATLASLQRELAESGISVLGVGALELATLLEGAALSAMLARCQVLCERALALNAPYIILVPSPTPAGWTDRAILDKSLTSLNLFADIAVRYHVRIGFEFLGFADSSVRTLAAARNLIAALNRPTVGLAVDTFHLYAGGSAWGELDELDPAEVFLVHLSDAEKRPLAELTDDHRLLPGDGIIPLDDFVSKLNLIGYRGFYSLELFRPEYWKLDPIELAMRGRQKMEAILRP